MRAEPPKVRVRTYSAEGRLLDDFELTAQEWYDGECPVIDSSGERVPLGIRRIDGEQIDPQGHLHRRWQNSYHEAGALQETRDRDGD